MARKAKAKRADEGRGGSLGERIRATFMESGMSRFELSQRADVSYAVVHRFIAGDRDLTLRTASRLAEALGLELRPKKE
jgi:plasmid maintenance system antidote protein VapI